MNLRTNIYSSISEIDSIGWNACSEDEPYLRHEFFLALEHSINLAEKGIKPVYITMTDQSGKIFACAPAAMKWGNKREFGPEINWLNKGIERHCFNWPKLQVGVPLFPVTGPRLLTLKGEKEQYIKKLLIQALYDITNSNPSIQALNIMHTQPEDADILEKEGWLISQEESSVWYNNNFSSFDHYVASIGHRKRRMMRLDRSSIYDNGIKILTHRGEDIDINFWHEFYLGYEKVCTSHQCKPWLTTAFFEQLHRRIPNSILTFSAYKDNVFLGGVFCLLSKSSLHVQTWSMSKNTPNLCFELVCYKPIEYAIENNIKFINTSVSASHKNYRGFQSEKVVNAHWFCNKELKEIARITLGNKSDYV
ncbi:Predicted N-acyltransferase [Oceanospirillum multiglobuliferum]|uniref:GNAT family N-acetyltransferase n=1 Tax=Oceanospirillum multiglobuliferum TaxID=64969 RepID=A0A1T4RB76_9GAMM|nr:peptidogalycan biosysnthesis protein [Oceanospirillum multiglobuliferum]OPX55153.1 hypothetical protein BTE48_10335 [Oceanospirillum multiglobuliferum]SKA12958.1 Predicted N-acyltransferase [Oceanospirillum multiglobuliferum]